MADSPQHRPFNDAAWGDLPSEVNRKHSRPKLSPRQREEIRQALRDGAKVTDLALQYSVSVRTIRDYRG